LVVGEIWGGKKFVFSSKKPTDKNRAFSAFFAFAVRQGLGYMNP